MTQEQYIKNLTPPAGPIDVVLDTDAYNEIDDQFAISYMLGHSEKLHVQGICAAPFYNDNSTGPEDGMITSYHEILKLLRLSGHTELEKMSTKAHPTTCPTRKRRCLPTERIFLQN